MFLKELWLFNKAGALIFILFILGWGYINYKQGAVAAPAFEYGMYSGKFYINDTLKVVKLYANNKQVDFSKYSMVERDMMAETLDNYINQKKINKEVFNNMKRILSKAGIGKLMDEKYYTNNISDKEFTQWYTALVEKILGYPVNRLDAYKQKYVWQENHLVPVDTTSKINCLVAN